MYGLASGAGSGLHAIGLNPILTGENHGGRRYRKLPWTLNV